MLIRIRCRTHDNADVVPADDRVMPELYQDVPGQHVGVYKIDDSNLYCLGGVGDHDFYVTTEE